MLRFVVTLRCHASHRIYSVAAGLLQISQDVAQFVHHETSEKGATVPFLARYRRDNTGGLDEKRLQKVIDVTQELFAVDAKRSRMLKSLTDRGLLTPALEAQFQNSVTLDALADMWEPYKERKKSKANRARELGLAALARQLLQTEEPVDMGPADAVPDGRSLVTAVLVEQFTMCSEARDALVRGLLTHGVIVCSNSKGEAVEDVVSPDADSTVGSSDSTHAAGSEGASESTRSETSTHRRGLKDLAYWQNHFASYHQRSFRIAMTMSHNTLAMLRGEKHKALRLHFDVPPSVHDEFYHQLSIQFPCRLSCWAQRYLETNEEQIVRAAAKLAFTAAFKSAVNTVRRELTKEASYEASVVFAHNLRHLLMQRPLRGTKLLAMDPGVTHGTKCVVLNETGGLVGKFIVNFRDVQSFEEKLLKVSNTMDVQRIVIGNGTACRQVERLVASLIETHKLSSVQYAITSEVGASVYSVSPIARREFPTLDCMYLGAVSIGRRVLDPLSELVKIPVRSLGVGQYQHDVDEDLLLRELNRTVEECITTVGVNMDSANAVLLSRLPGLARKDFDSLMIEKGAGRLHSREDLRRCLSPSAFTQVAGFIRFPRSKNHLDRTGVHPESYAVVEELMRRVGMYHLAESKTPESAFLALGRALQELDTGKPLILDANTSVSTLKELALKISGGACGERQLRLILQELQHPMQDPRDSLHTMGLFRTSVMDAKSLVPGGSTVQGIVTNVTQFGAFVDIGVPHVQMLIPSRDFSIKLGEVLTSIIVKSCDPATGKAIGELPPEEIRRRRPAVPSLLVELRSLRRQRADGALMAKGSTSANDAKSMFVLGAMTAKDELRSREDIPSDQPPSQTLQKSEADSTTTVAAASRRGRPRKAQESSVLHGSHRVSTSEGRGEAPVRVALATMMSDRNVTPQVAEEPEAAPPAPHSNPDVTASAGLQTVVGLVPPPPHDAIHTVSHATTEAIGKQPVASNVGDDHYTDTNHHAAASDAPVRRRGRPAKVRPDAEASDASPVVETPTAAADAEASDAPVRRRGRPAKVRPDAEASDASPVVETPTAAADAEASDAPVRRRGRPAKVRPDAEASDVSVRPVETPTAAADAEASDAPVRRRGRPAKVPGDSGLGERAVGERSMGFFDL